MVFVTVRNPGIPFLDNAHRAQVEELAEGVYRVLISFGFMESPNIPEALRQLDIAGKPLNCMQVSYFLGRETIVPAMMPRIGGVRRAILTVMLRNSLPAADFFHIPADRVVEVGVRVHL